MNGSIGTVTEIVYDGPRGPNIQGSLPIYVVMNFPESTLHTRLINNRSYTLIPTPITTD